LKYDVKSRYLYYRKLISFKSVNSENERLLFKSPTIYGDYRQVYDHCCNHFSLNNRCSSGVVLSVFASRCTETLARAANKWRIFVTTGTYKFRRWKRGHPSKQAGRSSGVVQERRRERRTRERSQCDTSMLSMPRMLFLAVDKRDARMFDISRLQFPELTECGTAFTNDRALTLFPLWSSFLSFFSPSLSPSVSHFEANRIHNHD